MSSGPSLYRRHRPRTFDDVVGQEHVVRTLRNAVAQEKVHHAYLFVGSRGTGKTSMAKILASCLNCADGPTVTPCGTCESCTSIAAATSMDVIEMDAASNNSVDDIRGLRERVAYAPVSGRHKVYILDEAHMLSPQAWNAFLKTLEEPPPNTVFVLATTEAAKVLPTVVDRCHRFDFARPTVEQIAGVVARVAAAEAIEIAPDAVGLLARHATGSFRDALGTLEQLLTYSGRTIATADVLAVLGVADADLIFAALDAIAAGDAREALLGVHRVAEQGRDLSSFARDLEVHARELLVVQTLGEVPPQVALTPDHDARLAEQADRLPPAAAVRLLDLLAAAMKAIRDGADARTQLELALVKAATPEVDAGTKALLARIERLERALASAPRAAPPSASPAPPAPAGAPPAARVDEPPTASTSPSRDGLTSDGNVNSSLDAPAEASAPAAPAPPPPAPAAPAAGHDPATEPAPAATAGADLEPTLDGILAVWPAVLEQLRGESMVLGTALASGRPTELDGRELVLCFGDADEFKRRKVETESRAVAEAIRALAGAPVRLRVERRELAPEEVAAPAAGPSEEELVARFVAEFDAEEIVAEEPAE